MFLLSHFFKVSAYADSGGATPIFIPASPKLNAESYLLIDAASGETLVEFNSEQRLPPASLTKIMTSYVAARELEAGRISLDDQVSVSIKAWRTKGSSMFIREGTRVRLEDILRGIIVQSGNDASVALAEHVAGDEAIFVSIMNQYASLLGMKNTNYVNATGLPTDDHYTTAQDLSILTTALIKEYPKHYSIYSEKSFTYGNISQGNRNRLLMKDSSVDGVKTGHIKAAGYFLVASALRDGMRLISVVMGTSSEESRIRETQGLLSYGFRYFETVRLYSVDVPLRQVRVWGGQYDFVNLGVAEDVVLTIPRGSREGLSAEINLQKEVHAPLLAGDQIGSLMIQLPRGEEIQVPLIAMNSVQEGGFFSYLGDIIALFMLKLLGGDTTAYGS